jgi:hypothetical protein
MSRLVSRIPDPAARGRRWSAAAAVFVFVLAARLALVARFGSPVPQWDQWDGEALQVYLPWEAGRLTAHDLLAPHLEHRILWTHLLNLGLVSLGGQWDPLVQMIANAALMAATAGGLAGWLLGRRGGRLWRISASTGVALLFAAPFGFQNALWGFQSQFAFLLGWALLAAWGLVHRPIADWRWWVGAAAGLAAPLAMGGGAAVGPALLVGATLQWLGDRTARRKAAILALAGGALTVWALAWRAAAPAMAGLHVGGAAQFFAVFLSALAWPNCQFLLLAPVALLPCGLLAWRVATGRRPADSLNLWLLSVAAWAVANVGGLALLRGAAAGPSFVPASRYHDILMVLALVNGLALFRVGTDPPGARPRWLRPALAGLWALLLAGGGGRLLAQIWRGPLALEGARRESQLVSVWIAGATGDATPAVTAGVYPDGSTLLRVLRAPELTSILPPEIQRPLGVEPTEASAAILRLRTGASGPPASWVSRLFRVPTAYLVLLARDPAPGTGPAAAFSLRDAATGRRTGLLPDGFRVGAWREFAIRAPRGNGQLVADLPGAGETCDFTAPRPLGALGYWVRRALGGSEALLVLAAAWLALATGLLVTDPARGPATVRRS